MNGAIRVFVNAGWVDVPADADVRAAVLAFDPSLERQIAGGSAYVTDGRGLEISPGSPLAGGTILRVIVRARKGESIDADA